MYTFWTSISKISKKRPQKSILHYFKKSLYWDVVEKKGSKNQSYCEFYQQQTSVGYFQKILSSFEYLNSVEKLKC